MIGKDVKKVRITGAGWQIRQERKKLRDLGRTEKDSCLIDWPWLECIEHGF